MLKAWHRAPGQALADSEQERRQLAARIATYRRGDAQVLSELDFAPGSQSYDVLLRQRTRAGPPELEAPPRRP